jgi:hypothetical protein
LQKRHRLPGRNRQRRRERSITSNGDGSVRTNRPSARAGPPAWHVIGGTSRTESNDTRRPPPPAPRTATGTTRRPSPRAAKGTPYPPGEVARGCGRPGARTSRPSVRFVLWSSAPPKQARPGGRAGSTFLPSPAAADCTRRPVVAPTHRNGLDRSAREVPQCSAQIVRYVATIGYMVEWVRPRSITLASLIGDRSRQSGHGS